MSFWFFVSYARDDRDDYLKKFCNNLRTEVLLKKFIPDDELSFLDVEDIKTGAPWKEDLESALRTSRVMIGLCSPAYVNSAYCGKEFQVFLNRQAAYAGLHRNQETPRAILPILWSSPSDAFPGRITDLQYADEEFPDIYAKEGLRYMMKLSEYKDDYEKFVTRLASKIVEAGEKYALPDPGPLGPLEEAQAAFPQPVAVSLKPQKKSPIGGLKNARFVYVAAGPHEFQGVKTSVECYGEAGSREWCPYLPPADDSVGIIAAEVASKQRLFYHELPLDENLVDYLKQAEKNQEIVVILVDAWTLQLEDYKKMMLPFDKINFDNCAVLIPWNEQDSETQVARTELEETLRETFKFKAGFRPSIYYRDSIHSVKDFRSKLSKTLTEIKMKMIEAGKPRKRISNEQIVQEAAEKGIVIETQPLVSGPGRSAQ